MDKIKVAVLGATGLVGQRFIELLAEHPYFEIVDLLASERSAGKKYREAANWVLSSDIPESVADMEVKLLEVENVSKDVDIVFSALPSDVAKAVEFKFAEKFVVCSNASAYRLEKDVPLVIPEINPDHIELINVQRKSRNLNGYLVTNPNCSTIIVLLSLKPIYDAFGIESFAVVTMQALSGAGYRGVPSMAIVDNLIPFIKKEEEKIEKESKKILGTLEKDHIKEAEMKITASCNRVPVLDGHTAVVFVKTKEKASLEEVKEVMKSFKSLPQELNLPTAPENPVIVREEQDRPQPRLDRNAGRGMSVTVGRIREDTIFDFKFVVLGHNTIRGAAGASVLNAELLYKLDKLG